MKLFETAVYLLIQYREQFSGIEFNEKFTDGTRTLSA